MSALTNQYDITKINFDQTGGRHQRYRLGESGGCVWVCGCLGHGGGRGGGGGCEIGGVLECD